MSHHHAPVGGNPVLLGVTMGFASLNWVLTYFKDAEVATVLAVISTVATLYCAIPQVVKTTVFLKPKAVEAWMWVKLRVVILRGKLKP